MLHHANRLDPSLVESGPGLVLAKLRPDFRKPGVLVDSEPNRLLAKLADKDGDGRVTPAEYDAQAKAMRVLEFKVKNGLVVKGVDLKAMADPKPAEDAAARLRLRGR